jgi:hypothetical protein
MACKGYDGRWRAKDMTPIGWHGLAELGRGRTAMPAGRTAGVTGGSVHGKIERPRLFGGGF